MYQGIDVSHYQGIVNWDKVKASGKSFAIIKATEGTTTVDPKFETNYNGAKAAGMHIGAYHFLRAQTVLEAVAEAKFFLTTIKGKQFDYPLICDAEWHAKDSKGKTIVLSKQLQTDVVCAFLDVLEAAGYYAMLYTNPQWLINYLDKSRLTKYDIWLAHWGTTETNKHKITHGIWQYDVLGTAEDVAQKRATSVGNVPGINTAVDVDVAYKDYTTIIKNAGLNHLNETTPTTQLEQYKTLSETLTNILTQIKELVKDI